VLGAADDVGRIGGDHLAGDQPVEQHPDRGQVLLDRWFGHAALELLDIGGHVQRLEIVQAAELVVFAPGEEVPDGAVVGHVGVLVADG